jgi:hypothetical protein
MTCDDRKRATDLRPTAPPCSLRQACARAGLDANGARCPECRLKELCTSELRWLVRRKLARRHLH